MANVKRQRFEILVRAKNNNEQIEIMCMYYLPLFNFEYVARWIESSRTQPNWERERKWQTGQSIAQSTEQINREMERFCQNYLFAPNFFCTISKRSQINGHRLYTIEKNLR